MPELPEVETIVRDLRPELLGKTIKDVEIYWPGVVHGLSPEEFQRRLVGRQFLEIGRRGKFAVFMLDGGLYLLIHLRMTGQLLLCPAPLSDMNHVRFGLRLNDGRRLYFRDTRKFGRAYLACDPNEILGKLGPEPLADDFTYSSFVGLLQGRKGMLKPLLMNQSFLAGLGNIYTDEALFAAGIHPRRKVNTLTEEETLRLYESIRCVLLRSISNRGTTLDSYRDARGGAGHNMETLQVFRRVGKPCPVCGGPIRRIVVGGRGTYVCERCQK